MPEGTKMSNSTPACSIGAVDARWLFPQEGAPSSPPRKTRLDNCAALLASEAKIDATFANFFAKLDARLEHFATLEALRARPGIAPSIHIPSSTMTWMSSPTAAGSMLWIKEVCARQDAHFKASLADFQSFADNINLRQPLTHTSFALLDDDNDNHDKDKAIPIVRSIDDADIEFKDIVVVLASLHHSPIRVRSCPSWGGNVRGRLSSPNMLSAFELATILPQKMAHQLKRPRCCPCCRLGFILCGSPFDIFT
jgi:hypothetical protein